jgi:EAL domain-containing protein (putative c-di-GMP-specific phosphodiesterase class I)
VALSGVAEAVRIIEELNRFSVGIAPEKFGTGFPSVSYRVLLNSQFLNIKKTVVRPPRESLYGDALFEAIVMIASHLDTVMLPESA